MSLSKLCINIRQRWIFAVMCFLGLFHAYAMRACLSITMTEIVVPIESEASLDDSCPSNLPIESNTTINAAVEWKGKYKWSEYTQGLILSSFYWGYIITHLPGGIIAEKCGGKHTYGIGIFITAVFTLLTPLSIRWVNSDGLIAMRVLMGLGEGTTYPAISVLLSQWIPPEERSRIGSFVYSGQLIGTMYANTVCGLILQYFDDWDSVFYLIGGVSAVWYLFWLILCYNNPREHPFISKSELNYLSEIMSKHTHEKPPPIPWRKILKSTPVWAAVLSMIGFNWAIITIVTDLPKYMSSVLNFSVENNGFVNSFMYICMWIGSIVTSWLADYVITRKYLSTTSVRKIGTVLALSCSSSFVVAASYAGCDQKLVIVMFAIAMGLMGAAYPSVMVNVLDLSPNYSGTITAVSNGISAGVTGILSPYIISIITPNQTVNEWRLIFWILFAIATITNAIFLLMGKGDVEYWNDLNSNSSNNKSNIEKNSTATHKTTIRTI